FLAARWHVRSVELTMLRAGEKIAKHTMAWIYLTRTSITKSSLGTSLDHLKDPRSKEVGGSQQSSLSLRLLRSISMLPTECSMREAQPCKKKRSENTPVHAGRACVFWLIRRLSLQRSRRSFH